MVGCGIGELTDHVPLNLDVLPELLHGDPSDGHGVADHHAGEGNDVPRGEREDLEHQEYEHGEGRPDQDGHPGDVLAAGNALRALSRRVAGDRHLHDVSIEVLSGTLSAGLWTFERFHVPISLKNAFV